MILYRFVDLIFQVYFVMLFVRVLLSWIPDLRSYRMVQFIGFYTDPYLNFFRQWIPPLGMIDISPIFAFLALGFIEQIVKSLIMNFIK